VGETGEVYRDLRENAADNFLHCFTVAEVCDLAGNPCGIARQVAGNTPQIAVCTLLSEIRAQMSSGEPGGTGYKHSHPRYDRRFFSNSSIACS
jgi:hypothetical protein